MWTMQTGPNSGPTKYIEFHGTRTKPRLPSPRKGRVALRSSINRPVSMAAYNSALIMLEVQAAKSDPWRNHGTSTLLPHRAETHAVSHRYG
ncbi:hypothetical protein AAFF_G00381380 [Aldrovandia affinis]|uniref:Uncharacterized protein n=1 Tax=Aldrovandia affinis TaxID=143900 RepID=A0AAD7T810_9TELE|nr:hypothetical protein AAFF_G00381380 [Aldrovandia affinis]